MSFWTQTDAEEMQNPKRKFRFIVQFDGITDGTAWWAKGLNKPSFTIAAGEHKYLNHTFYYPGSVTWDEISMTLVDPVSPDMASTLTDIVQASGYKPPTMPSGTGDELETISKSGAAAALKTVTITQVNADGDALEEWVLQNAWISSLKYGDLEYGGDDLTELTLVMKYDWATLTATNTAGSIATDGTGAGSGPYFDV